MLVACKFHSERPEKCWTLAKILNRDSHSGPSQIVFQTLGSTAHKTEFVQHQHWNGDSHSSFGGDFSSISSSLGGDHRFSQYFRLPADYHQRSESKDYQPPVGPFEGCVPLWRVGVGFGLICVAFGLFIWAVRCDNGWLMIGCWLIFVAGSLIWLTGYYPCTAQPQSEYRRTFQHDGENVAQKQMDSVRYAVRPLRTWVNAKKSGGGSEALSGKRDRILFGSGKTQSSFACPFGTPRIKPCRSGFAKR